MPETAAPLAVGLATWVADLRPEHLPPEIVADARLRLLDTLGIMLAARDTAPGVAVRKAVALLGQESTARIAGTNNFNTASLAALASGTLAHALDFDDTDNASVMHPSAVSVPTALAVARSGMDLILGIAVGNEIACRLGLIAPGAFHEVGQHPTSVLGTAAAALVAGRLMGLDTIRLAWALGIAASQGSGVLEAYSDGTWSKTLHPGWAAHAGIVAATLAQVGFSGPLTGLDGRYGLFATHLRQKSFDYEAATNDLGTRWHMRETAFKLYPCAHSIHAFIEAALTLRERHGLASAQIAAVVLEIPAGFIGQIAEPREAKLAPRTTTHARASVLYAVAAALAHGSLGMDDYTDAAITRPEVLDLARRVTHRVQASSGPIRFSGTVGITMMDGCHFSLVIEEADGTGSRQLEAGRVEGKFRTTAAATLSPSRIERVIALCRAVETLPSADTLLQATASDG